MQAPLKASAATSVVRPTALRFGGVAVLIVFAVHGQRALLAFEEALAGD